MVQIILPLFIVIIRGAIWGFVTQSIIDNKGYQENWFGWGFFFGIIAALVALSKPPVQSNYDFSTGFLADERDKAYKNNIVDDGGWRCHFCNRANPSYTGTCACGKTKADTLAVKSAQTQQINKQEDSLDKIKKLKELLDMGALTQEEFETKKKELLKESLG